ncbi:glycosyl hydrolase family 8 [Nonomuraea sp. NPDC050556]|uniref:glycosyl hydrolase family 8 n=1 Tax=Nonomuraea sp. NPDC050556 TaxID=3364369 RepID=UPI0037A0623F
MLFPRASALIAALALAVTACAAEKPQETRSPQAAEGVLRPTGATSQQVRAYYAEWKAAFVTDKCGSQQVISPDADHPYVGEAQGYGLVIAASMDDRPLFDGILKYVEAHPSVNNPDLLAAEQDKDCKSVNGSDSATDGDLDVAYGLLMADKRWGGYRDKAVKRINAIMKDEFSLYTGLMKLGDWATADEPLSRISRTSDWMIGHFRAFEKIDPEWQTIRMRHTLLIGYYEGTTTGLLPDFVKDGKPVKGKVLEDEHDGDYNWNALRDPWRIGADAATSGDPGSVGWARKITTFIRKATGDDPKKIAAGYTLEGKSLAEGPEPAFVAPFAVAALTSPDSQAWLDALWQTMLATKIDKHDYFAATVQLQSMIAVIGGQPLP